MSDTENWPEPCEAWRREARLSWVNLAVCAGITPSTLHRWRKQAGGSGVVSMLRVEHLRRLESHHAGIVAAIFPEA